MTAASTAPPARTSGSAAASASSAKSTATATPAARHVRPPGPAGTTRSTRSAESATATESAARTIVRPHVTGIGLHAIAQASLRHQRLIRTTGARARRSFRRRRHVDGRSLGVSISGCSATSSAGAAPELRTVTQRHYEIDFGGSRADGYFFPRGGKSKHFDGHDPGSWSHAIDMKCTGVVGQGAESFIALRRLYSSAGNRLIPSHHDARLRERWSLKEASREAHAGKREIFHVKNDEPPLTGVLFELSIDLLLGEGHVARIAAAAVHFHGNRATGNRARIL